MFLALSAVITFTWAQSAGGGKSPDLQLKALLPQNPEEAKFLVFYTTKESISREDSVNIEERRIIRFSPQEVSVDQIVDTIGVDVGYADRTYQILEAYKQPGKPVFLTNDKEDTDKDWLGFWVKDSYETDTLEFVYQKNIQKIEVDHRRQQWSDSHLNYSLLIAWILFLPTLVIVILALFKKDDEQAKKKPQSKSSRFFSGLVLAVFCISLIRIIFSPTILVIIAAYVLWIIFLLIRSGIDKSRKKKEGKIDSGEGELDEEGKK